MTGSGFPAVETSRLLLRPLALSDAPAIYAYQSDAEIHRYMSSEPPASADVVAEPIGRWLALPAEDRRPCWVIILRGIDRVVGTISFNQLDRKNASGQLGYEVAREQWGKGIGTEAVRAVISYGFARMGLNRISAYCWDGNAASRRVLEKAGMTYGGTSRQLRFAKGLTGTCVLLSTGQRMENRVACPCGRRQDSRRSLKQRSLRSHARFRPFG